MLVYSGEKAIRVEFTGGTTRNGGFGQFTTADESIQKAIESHFSFGNIRTHQIFLDGTFEEEQKPKLAAKAEPEITAEKPKSVLPTAGQMTFVQAKQHLIEKGVSPDELKNFLQVKSQAAKLGIEIVK